MKIVSLNELRAMRLFLDGTFYSGSDIMKLFNLVSGSVYPMLRALQRKNMLMSTMEQGDPREFGRPLRRLYCITKLGRIETERILEELR